MKNIVILISGEGSNMEAIICAAKARNWEKHFMRKSPPS
jgi:folate-dependent phosphoribosylglycinamide formyltransferase PurN